MLGYYSSGVLGELVTMFQSIILYFPSFKSGFAQLVSQCGLASITSYTDADI